MQRINLDVNRLLLLVIVMTLCSLAIVVLACTPSTALAKDVTEDEDENTTSGASPEIAKLPIQENTTSSNNANDTGFEGLSTNATTATNN